MKKIQTALIRPQKDLHYYYNWNKKLQCRFHTSIVPETTYYQVGEYYRVVLCGDYLYKARIVDIKRIKIWQLQPFMAALDTGYNLEQAIAILKKTYPDCDWETQSLFILLVENIEWEYPHQEFSFPLSDCA